MRIRKSSLLIILVLSFTLISCGKLRNSWTMAGYDGNHFKKIAVLGLSSSLEEQGRFEALSIDLFAENDINAVSGSAFFKAGAGDSAIQKAISNNKLDGILTISMVTLKPGQSLIPEEYNQFSKFHAHRYTEMNITNYLTTKGKHVIEAVFYDLNWNDPEGTDMVWRGEMAVLDPQNQRTKDRFVKRVINELVDSNLVKKSPDYLSSTAGKMY